MFKDQNIEGLDERLRAFDKGSKIIKLFNPNESRDEFGCPPRLCINTYVGCAHQCAYCYNHWMKGFDSPHIKEGFEKSLRRDIDRIFNYGLENLIVSISNSTDPLQEKLETEFKHSLFAFNLLREKNLKILITTKNPEMLLHTEYLSSLDSKRTIIQVTVPFLRDRSFESFAPTIENRISSLEKLIKLGYMTAVRIDPIIPSEVGGQDIEELTELIRRLRDIGVTHIISKVLRLVGAIQRRFPDFYLNARNYYKREGAVFYKNFWKLPDSKKKEVLTIVYDTCRSYEIEMTTCYENFPGAEKCDLAERKLSEICGM